MPLSENAIQIFSSVKAWIEPALQGVAKRMDDFDLRLTAVPKGEKGDSIKGDPGAPGKDVDPEHVKALVSAEVHQQFELLAGEFVKGLNND